MWVQTYKGFFYALLEVDRLPRKPKTPCRYRGCPNLCEPGDLYCEQHKQKANQEYEKYNRGYKSSERYGYSWRKIRDGYIKAHPLCEVCAKDGFMTPATLVHHKTPIDEGGTHEVNNLMSLCNSCHNKIHNTRGRKRD